MLLAVNSTGTRLGLPRLGSRCRTGWASLEGMVPFHLRHRAVEPTAACASGVGVKAGPLSTATSCLPPMLHSSPPSVLFCAHPTTPTPAQIERISHSGHPNQRIKKRAICGSFSFDSTQP